MILQHELKDGTRHSIIVDHEDALVLDSARIIDADLHVDLAQKNSLWAAVPIFRLLTWLIEAIFVPAALSIFFTRSCQPRQDRAGRTGLTETNPVAPMN